LTLPMKGGILTNTEQAAAGPLESL
jgi:hypothetical protein